MVAPEAKRQKPGCPVGFVNEVEDIVIYGMELETPQRSEQRRNAGGMPRKDETR